MPQGRFRCWSCKKISGKKLEGGLCDKCRGKGTMAVPGTMQVTTLEEAKAWYLEHGRELPGSTYAVLGAMIAISEAADKPNKAKVSDFDVMQAMSDESLDIRMAPMSNFISANKTKRGTAVTIGVAGNVALELMQGKLVGGLYLMDKDQYEETRKKLEASR